jgi:DNA-binding MarR family transcriptional regulator
MSTPDDLGAMIGYKLKQTQSLLRSRMDGELRHVGLSTPQYVCLELLLRSPGASHSELARAAFVTRQSMNTLLQGLTERGLVARVGGEAKGRAVPVTVTPEGERLLAVASARVVEVEQQLVSRLDAGQRAALHQALSLCAEALDD